jgi:hypothetical protein
MVMSDSGVALSDALVAALALADVVEQPIGAPLLVAAWRGEAPVVATLVEQMTAGARSRGEGCALPVAAYATAVLHNGLG